MLRQIPLAPHSDKVQAKGLIEQEVVFMKEFMQSLILAANHIKREMRSKRVWRHLNHPCYPWILEHAHGKLMKEYISDEADLYIAYAYRAPVYPEQFYCGQIFPWQRGEFKVALGITLHPPPTEDVPRNFMLADYAAYLGWRKASVCALDNTKHLRTCIVKTVGPGAHHAT